jgi:hypothetical protein
MFCFFLYLQRKSLYHCYLKKTVCTLNKICSLIKCNIIAKVRHCLLIILIKFFWEKRSFCEIMEGLYTRLHRTRVEYEPTHIHAIFAMEKFENCNWQNSSIFWTLTLEVFCSRCVDIALRTRKWFIVLYNYSHLHCDV